MPSHRLNEPGAVVPDAVDPAADYPRCKDRLGEGRQVLGPPVSGLHPVWTALSCVEGSTCPQWAQPVGNLNGRPRSGHQGFTRHTPVRTDHPRIPGQATLRAVKLVATICPTETRTIEAEAEDYDSAKALIQAQVPEGWQILQILTQR